jgi:hypothetical protein
MPVTSFGSSPAAGQGSGTPAAAPTVAPHDGGVVGHGVTRLMDWAPRPGIHAKFVPGAPPPRGETAGAHGAHKGRISIK